MSIHFLHCCLPTDFEGSLLMSLSNSSKTDLTLSKLSFYTAESQVPQRVTMGADGNGRFGFLFLKDQFS